MGDGAEDAIRGYIRAGMPSVSGREEVCQICGHTSRTGNICRQQAPRLKECPKNPANSNAEGGAL